jgi:hypothetical protein
MVASTLQPQANLRSIHPGYRLANADWKKGELGQAQLGTDEEHVNHVEGHADEKGLFLLTLRTTQEHASIKILCIL